MAGHDLLRCPRGDHGNRHLRIGAGPRHQADHREERLGEAQQPPSFVNQPDALARGVEQHAQVRSGGTNELGQPRQVMFGLFGREDRTVLVQDGIHRQHLGTDLAEERWSR